MNKIILSLYILFVFSCEAQTFFKVKKESVNASVKENTNKLVNATLNIIDSSIEYDGTYFSISYPNGDVPSNKGVCTDVVIRAYRKIGIDLQKEVHEDMKRNFSAYPKKWGLLKTDTNIDHRRVPNLRTFFKRKGTVLKVTKNGLDYKPGDIVTWNLGEGLTHIGIVINEKTQMINDTK